MESEKIYRLYLEKTTDLKEISIDTYDSIITKRIPRILENSSDYKVIDLSNIDEIMEIEEISAKNKKQKGVFSSALKWYKKLLKQMESISKNEKKNIEDLFKEDVQAVESIRTEGNKLTYFTTIYERDPKLRKKAISIHGLNCKGCGFNFERVYGELGKDYIEIHHLKPLSFEKKEHKVDPKEDLVPLCANCHRIVHRKKAKVLSIEKLQKIIQKVRTSKKVCQVH